MHVQSPQLTADVSLLHSMLGPPPPAAPPLPRLPHLSPPRRPLKASHAAGRHSDVGRVCWQRVTATASPESLALCCRVYAQLQPSHGAPTFASPCAHILSLLCGVRTLVICLYRTVRIIWHHCSTHDMLCLLCAEVVTTFMNGVHVLYCLCSHTCIHTSHIHCSYIGHAEVKTASDLF